MSNIYKKVGATTTASIYVSNEQEKLIITPSNITQKNRPVFYLNGGNPSKYISGLFTTKNPAAFSGDTKHPITGMKQFFTVTFQDEGETLLVEGLK